MRTFMIFMAAISLAFSASAQDILVKRNGDKMNVKVLKITKKKVEFVRFGTELPVYSLPISDIEYIEYPLGDRDTFGRTVKTEQKVDKDLPQWHGPVKTPDGKPYVEVDLSGKQESTPQEQQTPSQEQQTPPRWHGAVTPKPIASVTVIPDETSAPIYSIGDIYDKNGIKGVVVMLTDGGRHGVIMSLDEACLAWCNLHRKQQKTVGAFDRYDGAKNMEAVEKYITENALSWSNFPAFEWCRAKGNGWYLPSINELWSAGTMYLGGSRTIPSRKSRKNFNSNIKGAGGIPLSGIMIYHSSTEDKDFRYSLYSHMNSETPYIQSGYKADDLFVRAFHKF